MPLTLISKIKQHERVVYTSCFYFCIFLLCLQAIWVWILLFFLMESSYSRPPLCHYTFWILALIFYCIIIALYFVLVSALQWSISLSFWVSLPLAPIPLIEVTTEHWIKLVPSSLSSMNPESPAFPGLPVTSCSSLSLASSLPMNVEMPKTLKFQSFSVLAHCLSNLRKLSCFHHPLNAEIS